MTGMYGLSGLYGAIPTPNLYVPDAPMGDIGGILQSQSPIGAQYASSLGQIYSMMAAPGISTGGFGSFGGASTSPLIGYCLPSMPSSPWTATLPWSGGTFATGGGYGPLTGFPRYAS